MRGSRGDRRLTDEDFGALIERGAGNPLFLQELASPDQAPDAPSKMPDTSSRSSPTRIDGLAPRAPARCAGVRSRRVVLGSAIAAVLEEIRLAVPIGGVGPTRRVRRARSRGPRGVPLPPRAHPRRAPTRGSRSGAGASCTLSGRCGSLEVRTPDALELLSLHYHRADDKAATWRHSVAAGRSAQEKWANLEAAEFYERALEVARRSPRSSPPDRSGLGSARGLPTARREARARSGGVRDGTGTATEALPRRDRATPQGSDAPSRDGPLRGSNQLV